MDKWNCRKVMAADRLPTKTDIYITNEDLHTRWDAEKGEWRLDGDQEVEWWLEWPDEQQPASRSEGRSDAIDPEEAFLAGYKKRSEQSGLTCDFASELAARSYYIKYKSSLRESHENKKSDQ